MFTFSPSEIKGVGFEAMGVNSTMLTLYLGCTFIYMVITTMTCIVYGFAFTLRKHSVLMNRLQQKLKDKLIWRGIIRLLLESYLNMCIGIPVSLQALCYATDSDIFDIVLTCICTLFALGFPIAVAVILSRQ